MQKLFIESAPDVNDLLYPVQANPVNHEKVKWDGKLAS